MSTTPRYHLFRYGFAFLAVAAAMLLRWPLRGVLGDQLAFVFLWPAVLLGAWYGGRGPGLLATALAALAAALFLLQPRYSLAVHRPADLVGLTTFVVLSSVISLLVGRLHLAHHQASLDRQRLQVTLASIGDAVLATDTKGRLTFLNAVAESLTGWKQAEAAGRPLEEVFRIVNEQTRRSPENPARKVLETGRVMGLANHTLLIARDGTERPIDDSAAPIRDGRGSVVGVVLAFRDIGERRRAEEARNRLAAIVDSSEDAVIGKTLDGTITSWNAAAERLFGYAAAEAIGRPVSLLVPPERPDEVPAILEKLRRGQRVEPYETVRLRKDGTRVDVSLSVSPIKDTAGRVVGAAQIARDITARKQAEQALADSQRRLQTLFENAQDAILLADDQARYVDANPAACRLLGLSREELLRRTVWDVTPVPNGESGRRAWQEFLAAGRQEGEYRLSCRDGSIAEVEYRAVAHIQPGLHLSVLRDVSQRKRLEEELRRRAQELAEADRKKDEFIAMLAHELRGPLAPVVNCLQILRLQGGGGPTAEQALDTMERQLKQLASLVDDLLDIGRIKQGKVRLQKQPVELAAVVTQAVEATRPLIDSRRHCLAVTLPGGPLRLEGDPARLAQIFGNLLSNAARYTPEGDGRIQLTAEREKAGVVVRVRDNGVGIPADMLPRVFDLFVQVERGVDRGQAGLGIGLALVRSLVELHGGSVTATSPGPGRGSEFSVRLPLLPGAHHPGPGPERRDEAVACEAGRCRVLVVDDNRDAADSIAVLLRVWGHEVRVAYDGPEAVEAARRFRPEVVLLDLGLGAVSGYEVAGQLRQVPGLEGTVLVAMTGFGQEEDRRRTEEAGFRHHLVKPAEPEALRQLLAHLTPAAPKTVVVADSPAVQESPGPVEAQSHGELARLDPKDQSGSP